MYGQNTVNCLLNDFELKKAKFLPSVNAKKSADPASVVVTVQGDTLKNIYNSVFADPSTFNKKVKVLFISNGTIEGTSPKDAGEILKKAGINNIVIYQSPGDRP